MEVRLAHTLCRLAMKYRHFSLQSLLFLVAIVAVYLAVHRLYYEWYTSAYSSYYVDRIGRLMAAS